MDQLRCFNNNYILLFTWHWETGRIQQRIAEHAFEAAQVIQQLLQIIEQVLYLPLEWFSPFDIELNSWTIHEDIYYLFQAHQQRYYILGNAARSNHE
jgi:hypothetical protein